MSKSRLYVMVGVPGCGKTTAARQRFPQALRVSLDDLRLMLSGKSFYAPLEPLVASAADALRDVVLAYAVSHDLDVLIDATNVSRQRRSAWIDCGRRFEITPIAVFVTCPPDVAKRRNQLRPFPVPTYVVNDFCRRLEPPTLDEGFAEIITVDTTEDLPRN
jgi:predicted kinase